MDSSADAAAALALTSLDRVDPACLPILYRLWARLSRWDRFLYSQTSDSAGEREGACAGQRPLCQDSVSHVVQQLQVTEREREVRNQ